MDRDAFISALRALQYSGAPQPLLIPFVVVSFPTSAFWAKSFRFPVSLTQEQIQEAMELNRQLSLPYLPDDAFVDWEETPPSDPEYREFFLCAARKDAVVPYLEACNAAGLTVVAAEISGMSTVRILSLLRDLPDHGPQVSETRLLAMALDGMLHEVVASDSRVLALHTRAFEHTKEELPKRARAFLNFGLTAYAARKPKETLLFLDGSGEDAFTETAAAMPEVPLLRFPGGESALPSVLAEASARDAGWLVAAGAALRGLVPRAEDTFVSLMPLGTEAAYERRRAVLWSELAGNFVISVAALMALFFGFSLWVVLGQEKEIEGRVASQPNAPADVNAYVIQARNFNTTVVLANTIAGVTPRWEQFLKELRAVSNPGITLRHVVANENGTLLIAGTAASRESLLQLKTALEQSSLASSISVPATAFQEQANFPFSLEFRIEDPQFLYAP